MSCKLAGAHLQGTGSRHPRIAGYSCCWTWPRAMTCCPSRAHAVASLALCVMSASRAIGVHPTCRVQLGLRFGHRADSTSHAFTEFPKLTGLRHPQTMSLRHPQTMLEPARLSIHANNRHSERPAGPRLMPLQRTPAHRNPGAVHYPLLSCLARFAHSLSDPKHTVSGCSLQAASPAACCKLRICRSTLAA